MSPESASTNAPSNFLKRSAAHLGENDEGLPSKAPKLYPIFIKQSPDSQEGPFRWMKHALGPNKTCLHGVSGAPEAREKVACYDLDGCLIESSFPNKKVKGAAPSFRWWKQVVPAKLRQVYEEGYAVIIITNQALRGANALNEWKKKIPLIGATISDVPFYIFAAIARDGYRKPMPGIWYEIERIFGERGVRIAKEQSFYVGDAAGREGDHAGTDRKWALNVELPFFTPEEHFLNLDPTPYSLSGFNVSLLSPSLPQISSSSTPLIPDLPSQSESSKPEIVLFVGLPALGKSSFYRKLFQPAGYVHINQDLLGTRPKCVKAVEEAIDRKLSCVVDNTNRDAGTRRHYVSLAKKRGVPIRCIVFHGSLELAWHNNLYRAFNLTPERASGEGKRDLVPYSAFTSFTASYEEPQFSEGFSEIKNVEWCFEGCEEDRKRWSMWLQIDGK